MFWLSTDEPVDDSSVFQDVHRRNRLHTKRARDLWILVNIHLRKDDLSVGCIGGAFKYWPECLARPTPRGPQVDDDRD